MTWDQPKYGSNYQIDNYTVEQKTESSDSFEVVETLPYTQTGMMVKDLKPATQYTMRFSSNSKYGRSSGVILSQATLPGEYLFQNNHFKLSLLGDYYSIADSNVGGKGS